MPTIRQLVLLVPVFLLAISVHEFAHAWTAVRRGDPTPGYEGRLTLNFMKHLSFLGTLMLFVAGIGWAKPVNINPRNLPNPRIDMMWISLAGPLANFTQAVIFALLVRAEPVFLFGTGLPFQVQQAIDALLQTGVWLNLLLGFFNLIPIPPLDGAKILSPFIPRSWSYRLEGLAPYGFIIIYFLFVWGRLDRTLFGVARMAMRWLL